jgi:hypothetical protein
MKRVLRVAEPGELFDFAPDYLGSVGGMVSRPDQGALLLMTTPVALARSTMAIIGR